MGRIGGVEGGSWWEKLEELVGRNGGRRLVGKFREEIGRKKYMNSGKMLVDGVPDEDGEPVVKVNTTRMRGSKRKRMDTFRVDCRR